MSEAEPITVACLDLAGTTVADGDTVESAFAEAIATLGIVSGTAAYDRALARFRDARGGSKIAIFRALFDEPRAQAANLAFERSYDQLVDRHGLKPVPGADEALRRIRGAGVRVCLLTGFGRSTQARILDALDWWDRVDLTLCPADVPRGRPWPDLVLTAALRLGVDDVRHIAVCGDTANDMLTGRRSGASIVAGVLTGAHHHDRLLDAGATHVLPSVASLPDLILPTTDSTTADHPG
ncbi:HAD-IA family hydrolase [Actinomadura madurae]|uniref:HAD-IA family hydrolase n=1 Tax=Actinomadura madurae TaxID=1993 RepID=UPI002026B963|nr:HAD-IA family hydrolase [Actinomadura madurae]MCP9952176.1 HAD-IA family hydrolase [Actinomadura madurae]MCP9968935.1 HAD-IA family hydrolase [Actinomadura madurae]MCP9981408.1 HAD-IA family hydrolase [Actinomadura madurae]MCQ0007082.1 HAD-IA family hydrolase [Actinomadura madurae]MCQ0017611.1 HAD-IA family hydrolase [Actinomadura madurae]